ncbi:MAG: alpha/beta hydrolase [Massilia sp.]|nr:alpha/beta hydrolase [Massilia sp.]
MECDVLVLAGLWNSGPTHWQTLWEKQFPAWQRVPHRDWTSPSCDEWVAELDAAIAASDAGPPILVAHSLSCALVAKWAATDTPLHIAGAFLVAPSDIEADSFPPDATGFQPMPMEKLPFPSVLIASSDDPYCSIERAKAFAEAWGSAFVDIGPAGHINGDAGFGEWPEGVKMLQEFCESLQ